MVAENELRGWLLVKLSDCYEGIVSLVITSAALHTHEQELGLSRKARKKLRKLVSNLLEIEDCLGRLHSEVAQGYEKDLTHPINIGNIEDEVIYNSTTDQLLVNPIIKEDNNNG